MSRMAEIDAELRESGRIADIERLTTDLAWFDAEIADAQRWVDAAGDDHAEAMDRRSFLNMLTRRRRRTEYQIDEIMAAAALKIARAAA